MHEMQLEFMLVMRWLDMFTNKMPLENKLKSYFLFRLVFKKGLVALYEPSRKKFDPPHPIHPTLTRIQMTNGCLRKRKLDKARATKDRNGKHSTKHIRGQEKLQEQRCNRPKPDLG